jgi:hypothetical protein
MTRTKATTLVILAVVGAGAGVLLQYALAALGSAKLRPEYSLGITVAVVGVAAVVAAIPVRRVARGKPGHHVDPFYATSVVALAKAAAIGGALLAGFGLGMVLELLLRSGAPGGEAFLRVLSVAGGGIVLMIGGLVAEFFCTVPKGTDDDPDAAGPGPTATAG